MEGAQTVDKSFSGIINLIKERLISFFQQNLNIPNTALLCIAYSNNTTMDCTSYTILHLVIGFWESVCFIGRCITDISERT